jgi:hypothetical protein
VSQNAASPCNGLDRLATSLGGEGRVRMLSCRLSATHFIAGFLQPAQTPMYELVCIVRHGLSLQIVLWGLAKARQLFFSWRVVGKGHNINVSLL